MRLDAEIGLKAVEHLLGTFTAAHMRLARITSRCESCGSYRVSAGTRENCGWKDPEYEPVKTEPLSEAELAQRLAEPCTPSSDISTFLSPEDVT